MSRAVSFRLLVPMWLVMLALSACSAGPMVGSSGDAVGPAGAASGGRTDLATQHACRQRVNEMYETRGRADIYAPNSTLNSPYSANSQVGVPSSGLSNRFAFEQSIAECEHDAASGPDQAVTPVPPPAPPSATKGR
jgi:hypothetical protein